MSTTKAKVLAPDVGDLVEYGLDSFGRRPATWRVDGWLRIAPPRRALNADPRLDRIAALATTSERRRRWCVREEAEFVSLVGVCGAIAPVGECRVIGKVSWPQGAIDDERRLAMRLAESEEPLG